MLKATTNSYRKNPEMLSCDNCGHSANWKDHQRWNNDPQEYNELGQGYGLYKARNAMWNDCIECGCDQLAVHTNWHSDVKSRGERMNPNRNAHLKAAK